MVNLGSAGSAYGDIDAAIPEAVSFLARFRQRVIDHVLPVARTQNRWLELLMNSYPVQFDCAYAGNKAPAKLRRVAAP